MKTEFVIRNETIEAIWSDKDRKLYEAIGIVEKDRFSHVDPIKPPRWWNWWIAVLLFRSTEPLRDQEKHKGEFGIYWKGRLKFRWGVTCCDEAGRPFKTKAAAEAFEVAKLRRDYFKTLPWTILVQGTPPLEEFQDG